MSSAEAFVRVQRLLALKHVTLVFCGFSADSSVGKALQSVDVLGAEGVELFSTLNDAMECEKFCTHDRRPLTLSFSARDRKRVSASLVQISEVGSFRLRQVPEAGSWRVSCTDENYPVLPGRQDADIAYQDSMAGSLVGSPRRSHLRDAGHRTIAHGWF